MSQPMKREFNKKEMPFDFETIEEGGYKRHYFIWSKLTPFLISKIIGGGDIDISKDLKNEI